MNDIAKIRKELISHVKVELPYIFNKGTHIIITKYPGWTKGSLKRVLSIKGIIESVNTLRSSTKHHLMPLQVSYRILVNDGDEMAKYDSEVIIYGDTGQCHVVLLEEHIKIDTEYYRNEKLNQLLETN